MWVLRNDAHDRESLSGDLDAVLAQEFYYWLQHEKDLSQILDSVNYQRLRDSSPLPSARDLTVLELTVKMRLALFVQDGAWASAGGGL